MTCPCLCAVTYVADVLTCMLGNHLYTAVVVTQWWSHMSSYLSLSACFALPGGMVGGVVSTQRGGSPCRQERVTTTSPQPRHQAAAAAAAAGAAKNRRDGTAGAAGAAAAASMMGRNGMVAQPGAGNAQQGQHRADAAGRAGMNPGTDGVRAAGEAWCLHWWLGNVTQQMCDVHAISEYTSAVLLGCYIHFTQACFPVC